MTIEWWTEVACNQEQHVIINTFDTRTLQWQKPLKIDEKFRNFHGCQLKSFSSTFLIPIYDKGLMAVEISDMEVSFFAGALNLNDELELVLSTRKALEDNFMQIFGPHGNFSLENTAIRNWRATNFGDGDFLIFSFCTFTRPWICPSLDNTFDLDKESVSFIPCETYTNYEKMVFPFDFFIWISTTGVIILVALLSFAINRSKRFILIVSQRTSLVEIFGIIFGNSVNRVSNRNSIRIFILSFTMFCLIMRTAYQGVFFEMMTSDMRPPIPQSFKELNERNYSLLSSDRLPVELKLKKSDNFDRYEFLG